ncbi:MAG: DUF4328 domain-containing protein [Planctomycetaceae bacterium]|nr:DUF4328 domain-containing protein [Planctomycetaceae bacterium]
MVDVFRLGGTVPRDLAEAQDTRECVFATLQLGLGLAAASLFLAWLYRISWNSQFLRTERLRYTPGWSVGWFFVPIAGLFMPYYVVKELWKANISAGRRWHRVAVPRVLAIWWTACIANSVIQYSPVSAILGERRMTELISGSCSDRMHFHYLAEFLGGRILSDIAGVTASLLTVVVVLRLTGLQTHRREQKE